MKNETSFATEKEAARRERVNRAMKARFARRSTDTAMILAGVGNICSNTNTQYSNSNNRQDGKPVQADDFDHSYDRQEVEAEVVVQSSRNSLRPKPGKASRANAASKGTTIK